MDTTDYSSDRASIANRARQGSSTHVSLPIAPAKCATAVSTVMMRSKPAIKAAVWDKSAIRAVGSINGNGIAPGLLRCWADLQAEEGCADLAQRRQRGQRQ